MENKEMSGSSYKKFAITMTISFLVMYSVMFLNVFDTSDIFPSTMRFYMTLLMISPMALIMLGIMGSMFNSKAINRIIVVCAVLVFGIALWGVRTQGFIGDVQYMKGMIPHHSIAILTSSRANIKDPEVKKLADSIIAAQTREIAQMKEMIERLKR